MRPIRSDLGEHTTYPDISALLPWYVNQTLTAPERALVERYLAQSPFLREELAEWEAIANVVCAASLSDLHNLA